MMRGCLAGVVALIAVIAATTFLVRRAEGRHVAPVGYVGDPERGRALFGAYGCPSCHTTGMVGPPLDDVGARSYIAGQFPNIRGVMLQWLQHPQAMKPGTAMPELGVTRRDADDLAAYLATLR
jgi:cytochrome c2